METKIHDETQGPSRNRFTAGENYIAKKDRISHELMELSKMFVPTSVHLCKVEHHPAGAKLSHASTDLSLSFSLVFSPTCSLWTILPRSSILLHPAANTSFVSLLHPRPALVYLLLPLRSSSPVVCFEIRRQCRLPPWFANS